MSEAGSKWADLRARVLSAIVLSVTVLLALFAGPVSWGLLAALLLGLMLWELGPLCEPGLTGPRRVLLTLAGVPMAVVYALAIYTALAAGDGTHPAQPPWHMSRAFVVVLASYLALVPLSGLVLLKQGRLLWLGYAAMVAMACLVLIVLGNAFGPWAVLALVAVVVISDTAGYFVGRIVGGPKFWPRVSPKKTWSGTVAGWVGAGLFGLIVGPLLGLGAGLGALVAALLAFAGQMGDAAESAMKRRVGVKDASAMIPGHGGFLDRLDALIAAAALAGLGLLVYAL